VRLLAVVFVVAVFNVVVYVARLKVRQNTP
jgi:uncharacterized membrane protein